MLPTIPSTQDLQAKPSIVVVVHVDNGAKDSSRHGKYLVPFGEAGLLQSSAVLSYVFPTTSYPIELDYTGIVTILLRNRAYVSGKNLYKAIREDKRMEGAKGR